MRENCRRRNVRFDIDYSRNDGSKFHCTASVRVKKNNWCKQNVSKYDYCNLHSYSLNTDVRMKFVINFGDTRSKFFETVVKNN